VTDLPRGNVRLEVLDGKIVQVPLEQLRSLQRDLRNGTLTVALNDDQVFTGKLVELPKVVIVLGEDVKDRRSIPLERIAFFERTVPAIRRF
jgi:hypothetical protein